MQASTKSNLIDLAFGLLSFTAYLWFLQIFELETVYLIIIFSSLGLGYLSGANTANDLPLKITLVNSANFLFVFSILSGTVLYTFITLICLLGTLLGAYLRRNKQLKFKQTIFLSLYCFIFLSFAFIAIPKLIRLNRWFSNKEALPEFKVLDMKNDTIYSSTFKNKVVVMDFWTSWCGPCQKGLPKLEEIRKKYLANSEIQFAFVNTGQREKKENALSFIKRTNYDLPYYFDIESRLTKKLKLGGIPVLILIDKKGVVRLKHIGYDGSSDFREDLISRIDSLLAE